MDSHTIIHGDSRQVLPTLESESVDLVVTDPPYLCRYKDRNGRSVLEDHKGSNVLTVFAEVGRILRPNRYCVSFYGWNAIAEFSAAWKDAGLRTVGHIVWVKNYASGQSHTERRHESAFVLAKGYPGLPEQPISDVQPWVYTKNKLHPTQKSVDILRPLIRSFSRSGDLVLDPFCGSGSTLLAASLEDRRSIGVELDASYCDIARRRVRESGVRMRNTTGPAHAPALTGC